MSLIPSLPGEVHNGAAGNNEKECYDIAKKLLATKLKKRKSRQSKDDKRSEDIQENENDQLEVALKVKKKVIREENKKKTEARSQAAFQKAKSMFGAGAIKMHDQVEISSKTTSEENENVKINNNSPAVIDLHYAENLNVNNIVSTQAADTQPTVTTATSILPTNNSSNLTPLVNFNQSSITNCQQPSPLNNWQQPLLVTNNWQQSSASANWTQPMPCTPNWQRPLSSNWQQPSPNNWYQPSPSNLHQPSPSNWHQPSPSNWHQPSPSNLQHQPSPSNLHQPSPSNLHQHSPNNLQSPLQSDGQPPLTSNWQQPIINTTRMTNTSMSPIPSAHRSAFSNVFQPKPIRNHNTNTSSTSLFNPFEVMTQDDSDFEATSESLREESIEVPEEELEVSSNTSMHVNVNEMPKTILNPLRDEKIKALELQLSIARQDLITKESEGQNDNVQQGQQGEKEYKRRGSKLTRTDYKILSENLEMPPGYQHLVSGGTIVVKTAWLKETLLKLRKKDATCALKMMVDCFMSPHQYGIRGGTSAFKGSPLEPVMTDIERFGIVYFKLSQATVVRAVNEKMYSGRKYLHSLTDGHVN